MEIHEAKQAFDEIKAELSKVVIGQEEVIKQLMIGVLTGSHVLMEGYPGVAKTLIIRSLSEVLDLSFARVQNTPDLMPSDITGTYIIQETDKGKRTFKFQHGPIFANVVLADEINRATPKTQSAMLEAMQEKQVTVAGTTHKLEEPFFVLATQNPIEQEGTYPLPEAQTDRFLLKVYVGYPSPDEELKIVNTYAEEKKNPVLRKLLKQADLLHLQELTRQVPISNDLKKYAVTIVNRTRTKKDLLAYGASPRAAIGLVLAAKANALLSGRKYVSTEDIKIVALAVLRHRIIPTFEAERQGLSEDDIVRKLL